MPSPFLSIYRPRQTRQNSLYSSWPNFQQNSTPHSWNNLSSLILLLHREIKMAMFSPNFTSLLSGKPAEIFQGTLVGRWAHKITYQVQEKLKGQMCNDKRITDNPTNWELWSTIWQSQKSTLKLISLHLHNTNTFLSRAWHPAGKGIPGCPKATSLHLTVLTIKFGSIIPT